MTPSPFDPRVRRRILLTKTKKKAPANRDERYDAERRARETFVSRVDEVFAADAAAWDVAGSDAGSDSFDIDGAVNAWTSWATSKLDTHLKNLNTKYQSSWAPAVDRLREQAKKKFEQEWAAQFPSDEEYKKELGSKEYPSELNYALPEVPLAERVDEDPAVAKKVS